MTQAQAEQVWAILYAQWPERAVFRYLARSPQGHVKGLVLQTPEALARTTTWADSIGWNSYVQMNPTYSKVGDRPKGADISHWSWFLVDIDPIGPNPNLAEAQEYVSTFLLNYLGAPRLDPTVIFSGRGRQLWFPMEPLDLSKEIAVRVEPIPRDFNLDSGAVGIRVLPARDVAPRAAGYWLDLMKDRLELHDLGRPDGGTQTTIDTSVSDLPRVMRVPFTKNYKTGRMAELLHLAERPAPGLAHKLISYTPHRLWKEPEVPAGLVITEGMWWGHFLQHMKATGRIYITEGASEGGRHKAATAALLNLKEIGCGREQALAALLHGAKLCTPELPAREIIPMIERHYRRAA